jgi:hypothetical protein
MKAVPLLFAGLIAWLFIGCVHNQSQDYVLPPTKITRSSDAVTLAESALESRYGNDQMLMQRPYTAVLRGGIWNVYGSLAPASEGSVQLGGVAEVRISAKTGRILTLNQEE